MNKTELVAVIAEAAGITKTQANDALNAFFDAVNETLKEGEKVTLIGFGTFETRERSERVGQNPQTHEKITIPATTIPAFKPSKNLKDAVKEGAEARKKAAKKSKKK